MQVLNDTLARHPCFGKVACRRFGRIHLPVAPKCNIQCAYCDRRFDCPNESRPGVTSAVLDPEQAVRRAVEEIQKDPRITVVGIAGPGDALCNDTTFATLRGVRLAMPDTLLCLSTNGFLVEERMEEIIECGVDTVTVTINASTAETGQKIYSHIIWKGELLSGEKGVVFLLERQRKALALLSEAGISVKVNTVLIPGVNDGEIRDIAKMCREAGAAVMNIIPMIPCGKLRDVAPPTDEQVLEARGIACQYVHQFLHCQRCRADAVGLV